MKIALMVRGPIRPSAQSVSDLIIHYTEMLSGHDIDVFLGTWNSDNLDEFLEIRKKETLPRVNLMSFNEPEKDYIDRELFPARCRTALRYPNEVFPHNTYKQFWLNRELIKTIVTYKKYDHIVYSRTDMRVHIGDLESWLSQEQVCVAAPSTGQYPDDRFAIATPENMWKSFEFRDLGNLNNMYGNSENAEHCWFQIMNQNGTTHRGCPVGKSELIR